MRGEDSSSRFLTSMRDGAQFMMYEQLRRRVQAKTGKEKLPTWQHLVLGGASGATAALATMPLDFAKTVLQCGTSMPVHEVIP